MKQNLIGPKSVALAALLVLDTACGSITTPNDEATNLAVTTQADTAVGTWTKLTTHNPFSNPNFSDPTRSHYTPMFNLGLLTDGRVIFSTGSGTGAQHWHTLTRDVHKSYVDGTIADIADAPFTTEANPSWLLNDGRYMIAAGEYNNINSFRPCTIYDPVGDTWSDIFYVPRTPNEKGIGDTPSATLADGRAFFMAYGQAHGWIFDPRDGSWFETAQRFGPGVVPSGGGNRVTSNEGASLLLSDGTVLIGSDTFTRYDVTNDQWIDTGPTPGPVDNEYSTGTGGEIGPFLLLHGGEAMILGATSKNGIYRPETEGWVDAADTPLGLNHGDSPGCVETTGNVLSLANSNTDGGGTDSTTVVMEYQFTSLGDPHDGGQWVIEPDPPDGPFGHTDDVRMLQLPTGEVLVLGHPDDEFWFWTPAGNDDTNAAPHTIAITSTFGQFRIDGQGLNGGTNGADVGDDAKMGTNFPTVTIESQPGTPFARIFPPTYGFDTRVPSLINIGHFYVSVPSTLPPGNYVAIVNASGLDATPFFAGGEGPLNFTLPLVDAGLAVERASLWNF